MTSSGPDSAIASAPADYSLAAMSITLSPSCPMFKKRVVKTRAEAPKRPREDEEVEQESLVPDIPVKKFHKAVSASRKPVRDVIHSTEAINSLKTQNDSGGDAECNEDGSLKALAERDRVSAVSGPIKPPPANVRVATITDFQPDVCKDFQQTGYCGYGDTCKFLHIRDELKARKPVDKQWETVSNPNVKKAPKTDGEPVPFKCVLCKNDYKSPVKVNCGHVFCQKCFMDRCKVQKRQKCYICGKDTGGAAQPVKASELAAMLA